MAVSRPTFAALGAAVLCLGATAGQAQSIGVRLVIPRMVCVQPADRGEDRDEVYVLVRGTTPRGEVSRRLPADDEYAFAKGTRGEGRDWATRSGRRAGRPTLWSGRLADGQEARFVVLVGERDEGEPKRMLDGLAPVLQALVSQADDPDGSKGLNAAGMAAALLPEPGTDDVIGSFAVRVRNRAGTVEALWAGLAFAHHVAGRTDPDRAGVGTLGALFECRGTHGAYDVGADVVVDDGVKESGDAPATAPTPEPAPKPRAVAGPPEEVLKEKGLRKAGSTYLLPAEADVAKGVNRLRNLARAKALAAQQQQALAQGVQDKEQLIRELTEQRLALNRQLGQGLPAAEHNRVVTMFNDVTDRLNLLQTEGGGAAARVGEQVHAEAARKREAYVQALLDLRALVDKVSAKYNELARDPDVTRAIAAINAKAKAKVALGPSRAFKVNVQVLEKAEGPILTGTIPLRGEGVFRVDVVLNGKVVRPFVFDTGASIVLLSASVAAEAGLDPARAERTISCRVADGRTVDAKLMTLASMRVGQFTVKDVACAVLPPDAGEADPLLGGTFLRHFTYKLNPDAKEVTLTRVDDGDEAPARPAPKPPRAARKR